MRGGWTGMIAGVTLLSVFIWYGTLGKDMPVPFWTTLTISVVLLYFVGFFFILSLKAHSAQLLTPSFRQSINTPRPTVSAEGSRILGGGITTMPFGGFASTSGRSGSFSFGDKRFLITREDLKPFPLAPGSHVYISRGIPTPVDDRILSGLWMSVRDGLLHHATYSPKKAFLRTHMGLLSVSEADMESLAALDEVLRRSSRISDLREIIRAPDGDIMKILKSVSKKGRDSPFYRFFKTEQITPDEIVARERGKSRMEDD